MKLNFKLLQLCCIEVLLNCGYHYAFAEDFQLWNTSQYTGQTTYIDIDSIKYKQSKQFYTIGFTIKTIDNNINSGLYIDKLLANTLKDFNSNGCCTTWGKSCDFKLNNLNSAINSNGLSLTKNICNLKSMSYTMIQSSTNIINIDKTKSNYYWNNTPLGLLIIYDENGKTILKMSSNKNNMPRSGIETSTNITQMLNECHQSIQQSHVSCDGFKDTYDNIRKYILPKLK